MHHFCRKKIFSACLFFLLPLVAIATLSYAQQSFGYGQPSFNYGNETTLWSRLLQHLIALSFGALLGAFFSDRFKKYRRWIFLGLIILVGIFAIVANVFLGNVVCFIIGFVAAYMLLKVAIAAGSAKKRKNTTFGSAEWADLEHLQENKLIGNQGFSLGVYTTDQSKFPIQYTGDRHLLTVAPTRSGKGVASIIPNLLTYTGSAVVIDPKGENAMITATRRGNGDREQNIKGLRQTIHVVDPWGITGKPSSRFNPLDWLDPKDPDINENAMILADSIIPPAAGSRDSFWEDEAKALLMGFLLWVALEEKEKKNRTLGRVRDIISYGADTLNDLLEEMAMSTNRIVSSAGVRTRAKEERLRSNVLATLQSHTHFLDSPRIRENLSVSDFRFEDLKTSKTTIYLVLPADRLEPFGRWLRLLIQQSLTVNARNIEIKTDKPVLFLLDEMAALGRLNMVEQAYSLMAGFGVQLWGIVQDLSQLERIYGSGWQTFIGNSGVLQYFGSRDLKTAEYFSKLCGVTTIEKFSFAQTIARAFSFSSGSGQSSSSSNSTTYSDAMTKDVVQRHLAFPDELMVLRDNKEIVFIENFNPVPAKKEAWFNNDLLKEMGTDLHKKKSGAPVPPPPSVDHKAPAHDKATPRAVTPDPTPISVRDQINNMKKLKLAQLEKESAAPVQQSLPPVENKALPLDKKKPDVGQHDQALVLSTIETLKEFGFEVEKDESSKGLYKVSKWGKGSICDFPKMMELANKLKPSEEGLNSQPGKPLPGNETEIQNKALPPKKEEYGRIRII